MPVKLLPAVMMTEVAARLRALQAELGYTNQQMGTLVGATRTRWLNWARGANLPDIEAMKVLCDYCKVTLDWLYRGHAPGIDIQRYIRLEAHVAGLFVPDARVNRKPGPPPYKVRKKD